MNTVKKLRSLTLVSRDDSYDDEPAMLDGQHRECVIGNHSNAFYLRPEEDDRVYFDARTAAQLLPCEGILQALMESGIHNWEYYDSAMEKFKKEWKK